jgi:hypothetical protein
MKEYLIGVLGEDDGINGFLDQWVQRHAGLPFPAFLLSLWPFRPLDPALGRPFPPFGGGGSRKLCEKPNEFAKIQVNPTKSDLFFYGSRAKHAKEDLWLCDSATLWPTAPFFTKVKITKRTQFKNRTICHPRQFRMTT